MGVAEVADVLTVEQFQPAIVDAGHCNGHGAVQEHLPVVQFALVVQAPEVEQEVLGTTDGEGRDHHAAARFPGLLQNIPQLNDGILLAAMFAIAIGTLDQQDISPIGAGRFIHQDRIALAKITGKNQHLVRTFLAQGDLNNSGTQDMARIVKTHGGALPQRDAFTIAVPVAQAKDGFDIFHGVDRVD